jgi:hypothetical protein
MDCRLSSFDSGTFINVGCPILHQDTDFKWLPMYQGIDLHDISNPGLLDELLDGFAIFTFLANWILLFLGMMMHYPILVRNKIHGSVVACLSRTLAIKQGLFCFTQSVVLACLEWGFLRHALSAEGKLLSGETFVARVVIVLVYVILIILPGLASMALWIDIGKRCIRSKPVGEIALIR